jgi:hypothetical protein
MAYSTRRKSVNLSLLGIHVPRPHQQRSPPVVTALLDDNSFQPPQKKLKRSHSDATSPTEAPDSPSKLTTPRTDAVRTPPASPPPTTSTTSVTNESQQPQYPKVDTEGINDDVVVATIELLEKYNNRPLMLKELATTISQYVHVVET